MNRVFKFYSVFVIFFFVHQIAIAQKGPGGVSHESVEAGSFYSNIVWLNASTIETTDGGNVPKWQDIAPEPIDNSPSQNTLILQPFIRKDISASINGKPILQFGDGRKLLFSSNKNFNNKYVENRTTFMVFRTSGDVNTMQVIYEEGGNVRGLNVYIYNGELYFGGYDHIKDGDNTPSWPDNSFSINGGNKPYAYTKVSIQPYTTYVVSHIFHGEKGNNLDKGYITGYINGVAMPDSAKRIGALGKHPDTPGLGAVNGNTIVHTLGVVNGSTTPLSFLGDYAEFIVYDFLLNNAERTIVENYLASKYFANSFSNDFFEHKVNFGNDVIGIGRSNTGDLHNLSQGQNPFIIKADPTQIQNNEYLFLGHNNKSIDSYVSSGTPGVSTLKLEREWRADQTGDLGKINFRLDKTMIPAPPEPNYTKYVLLIDKSGGNQSNFSNINTEVVELVENGSWLETDVEIPDNAFITVGLIEPTVYFPDFYGFGFEEDINSTANFTLALNYIPSSTVTAEFNFKEIGEAMGTSDFIEPANTIVQFNPSQQQVSVNFDIVGDNTTEPEEKFVIELLDNANLTTGISINESNSQTFSIYDNDHTPNIQFANTSETFSEGNSNSTKYISVVRDGDLDVDVSVDYGLSIIGSAPTQGTATNNTDYSISSGTIHFGVGETTKDIQLNLTGDEIFESDETVILQLSNIVNANLSSDKYLDTVTIKNDDLIPNVEFKLSEDQNPEIIGNPEIEIIADKVSAFDIVINYEISPLSTATNGIDYSLATTGSVIIPAGETTVAIPIINTNDAEDNELPETIIINLTGINQYGKLKAGGKLTHTYTIIDYISFEWDGAAGVGKSYDNLFWFNADKISGSQNSTVSILSDYSPNNLNFKQSSGSKRAKLQTTIDTINNRKVLKFDGVDDYYYDNFSDARVNKSGYDYKNRTIVAVFKTSDDINSRQIIFEQGKDNTSGIVLGFENSKLVGQIWGNSWGGTASSVYVESALGLLEINQKYIITLDYCYNSASDNYLRMYLNGSLVGEINNSSEIGVIAGNNNNLSIGGTTEDTRFKNSKDVKNNVYFKGDIAEILYYGSSCINKARIKIIENYLAAKYDISFTNIADKLYRFEDTHSYDVIGIGADLSNNYHLDSKGTGIIRIKNPTDANSGKFLFIGHDNKDFSLIENVPDGFNSRINRTWQIDKSGGDLGKITLIVDATSFSNSDGYDIEILIDNDQDFSNARKISSTKDYDNLNEIITFDDIDLKDGEFFTFALKVNKWTGQVSKNWTNPDNWNGNIPNSGNTVIIPSVPIGGNFPETMTENSFTIRNLILEPESRVAIPTSKTVNVLENLIFETQQNNNPSGMILDQGTINISGETIIRKYLSREKWHYISIPLLNVSSNILTEDGYNPNLITYSEEFDGPDTYDWSDYAQAWNFLQQKNEPEVILERGIGHAFFNNRSLIFDINGEYSSAEISVPISYTQNDVEKTDGWNFLGNPFTCSVNWDNINTVSKDLVDNTIYYWTVDPVSGEQIYSYYNGAGGSESPISGIQVNGGSKYILPNQGFFVHAKSNISTGSHFTVDRDSREFYPIASKATKKTNPNFIKLSSLSSGMTDETVLRIIKDASFEHDSKYDAYKRISENSKRLQIFTLTDKNTDLAINTIPDFEGTIEIPLGFISPSAGEYTIKVTDFQFSQNYSVSISDNKTGTLKNLSANDEFTFEAEKGVNSERFKIIIKNSEDQTSINTQISETNLDFYVYEKQLHIQSEYLNNDLKLEVYSITGGLIYKTLIQDTMTKLDIPSGVYVVKVSNKKEVIKKQIFIK